MSKTIALSGTKNGIISVVKVEKPYGEESDPVASIGISLNGEVNEPDWKVHIPLDNIDEVVEALQSLR